MEERLLLFTLAGEGFALNLQEVAEVMEPPPSYPIPKVPGYFAGLINFHGTLTALVDLGLYLGGGRRTRGQEKVLVLDTRIASLALLVDAVACVIPASSVLSRTPGEDELTAEIVDTAQGKFRLFKVEPLVSALERELAPPAASL